MASQADPASSGGGAPRRRWSRFALGAVLVLLVAFAGLAAVLLSGVAVPGELLRAPLERALTAAFGVPTRIEGPLKVRTGLAATASADALVLDDPSGPPGAVLARATRPGARIDLLALLRRAVALDEVTGERLELNLVRPADGRANWAPIFTTAADSGPRSVAFAGIARLRVASVTGSYRGAGTAPVRFAIAELDAALPLRAPMTARGSAQVAGYTVAFDLRTASLTGLQAPGAVIPLQGTLGSSGAHMDLDGNVAGDGARLDAAVRVSADDARPLLAALGVAAHDPGRLDARARVGVTARQVVTGDLALTLGKSALSGGVSVAWGAPRARVAIDVAGERVNLDPFLSAAPLATDKTAAEVFIERLESAATGVDAEVKLAVGELAGLPVTLRELKLDGRSRDRVIAVRGDGVVAGTRAKTTLDYDARKPQRVLAARLDGGAISTAKLPRGERPQGVSGSTGGIRGELRGQGASPRAVVESLQGSLEARDLRWTLAARDGQPINGRFDTVRIAVQGTRASSAEVTGRLGDAACRLKVSGGALAPLLEGGQWPVELAGSCAGGRLSAKGRVAIAERHLAAELAFDASADRIGPIARALGVAPDAPHPFAARGALALDEKRARVRLDALRLGRSAGSGQIDGSLDGAHAPRVQLQLASADFDELAALFPQSGARAPADPLMREVLPAKVRLPELEFDVTADTARLAGETLRRVHAKGATRDGHLPRTPFGFEWSGAPASADIALDFRGASPQAQLDGSAQNANLGALLARFGHAGVALRAGTLTLHARAEGARLGELLANATLDTAIERGRLDLAGRPAPGLNNHADFSATLKAAPGRPATLEARGTLGSEPFSLSLDTPQLAGLARTGATIPATLRATLGDARLEAAGNVARDGAGDGRVQLSGGRIDRLGKLAGVALPEVGPYAASGTIVVTADAIRASDLDVSFGRSRVLGQAHIQLQRAGRPLHSVALRAPALHLEDVGAARWLGGPAGRQDGEAREAPVVQRAEAEIARGLELLRASDIDAAIEVGALHGGGEEFAKGQIRATLNAGMLRVLLQDMRTATGAFDADLQVDASSAQPKLGIRAHVRALEYGPLVRTVDPATTMGGRLDLVADLAAQGAPGHLLPALAGTVDIAVYPHGLDSRALDYWGTGLLRSMVRTLDPTARSEVECAAASLDLNAGVARTRALFVDTTNVRVIGQVDVDLTSRALTGRVTPHSQHPELVTVAPTMVLGGTVEDPRVTVAPENVVLAPLRFATPLAGFALDFLSAKGRLREGVAGCREAFDRALQLHLGSSGAK